MTINTAPKPATPAPFVSHGAAPLTGRFALPGDAEIAAAALLLAALTVGSSTIDGLPDNAAVVALMVALRQLGVRIERQGERWQVDGLGVGGLLAPEARLALEQAPHIAPLLLGLLAPAGFSTQFSGMPPSEVLLAALGSTLDDDPDGVVLTLRGAALPVPLAANVPSATTKAALLLAAAQTTGISTLVETVASPDHMEKLLAEFGGAVTVDVDAAGVSTISVTGLVPLTPRAVAVPGDPGLAAYPLLAGLIVPGSDLLVENVLIDPTRTGLIDTLLEMGGDIQFLNQQQRNGEHVADLQVRSSRLRGVRVSAEHAVAMLDDIAVLAVAAAYAQGETVIEGLGSMGDDRLEAMAAGLTANQVAVELGADRLTIIGNGAVVGGGTVGAQGDASLAMSLLLLGLASQHPVSIDEASAIDAAFPGFIAAMTAVGARLAPSTGVLP